MKILVMYEYPPSPGGLATQGDLLYRGLREIGVEAFPVHLESSTEKEWYYRWFKPDVAVGVGYWGYSPDIILHPHHHGILPVPWLVADGYVANYRDVLTSLPLILVTSNWVRDVYRRDGILNDHIEILPVGCDTDRFAPSSVDDPRVRVLRERCGVRPGELVILTAGGDAASKGGQEVMKALARIQDRIPPWRYVVKVWPQSRTEVQNSLDLALARSLGIADRYVVVKDILSRNIMPSLLQSCDIYAAPARLEGFGMSQVEAGSCGKPVIGINAMGMLDTLVHGETAFLAGVEVENLVHEVVLGPESGYPPGTCVTFDPPRVADYRASVDDIAEYLTALMNDPGLRQKMGEAGRRRAVELFDYRTIARRFVDIIQTRLGIS
ncbi:MAG TPA: glycosyltransferase family 4 protein [Anaerolineaceae bacterium]